MATLHVNGRITYQKSLLPKIGFPVFRILASKIQADNFQTVRNRTSLKKRTNLLSAANFQGANLQIKIILDSSDQK